MRPRTHHRVSSPSMLDTLCQELPKAAAARHMLHICQTTTKAREYTMAVDTPYAIRSTVACGSPSPRPLCLPEAGWKRGFTSHVSEPAYRRPLHPDPAHVSKSNPMVFEPSMQHMHCCSPGASPMGHATMICDASVRQSSQTPLCTTCNRQVERSHSSFAMTRPADWRQQSSRPRREPVSTRSSPLPRQPPSIRSLSSHARCQTLFSSLLAAATWPSASE